MATFDAILFDLDGTLIQNDQTGEDIYAGAFSTASIDRFGDPADLWSVLDEPPSPTDPETQLASGFERVAAQYGRSVDAHALAHGFMETVDHTAVSFLPGAVAALETAQAHAHVGLVTNGPEHRQAVKLDALDIGDAFDVVVFAGDMPRRKPHPDPFDRALTRLEADATNSVHVGNSLEFDVVGAQRAGLDAAWCPGDVERDFDDEAYSPEYVLSSLHEFGDILGDILDAP
ncbi:MULTISPECIES: HAD family hydrolase [Haloferax]|uniref:HAD-IA family hydrolase n=1 Tax=Haloferax marinum TaxID=2666143 RepID=A0A6A8G395_9EURY|nr:MULTISPECIES: HAD family hydrolase [Haloferax]KAB1196357.1 HAD family hydrolase [Haloferax sp. CBA1150]MRW95349.1 HAD-IA family hydrolase [Haloferax marinum]